MKKLLILILSGLPMAGAMANPFAEADSFLCTLNVGHYCVPSDGCHEVDLNEFQVPRFIEVDREEGVLVSVDDPDRADNIEHEEVNGGTLFLQGVRHRRGWTMAIPPSGHMMLSAAADGETVNVFGSCTTAIQP